ncbi:hypothetical protein KDW_37830 [Dictyobacter vulcani]|uniref:Uncharacterized protein n=1 Tax=Dictyobacter vulcani TaxID=2607529 RepID=A0A5J4KT47_9CHLR|nr:hypothetical protein [Dictyobacter vulcani]GER89621.1 hypothetical protein KDW_37830 [Dictyobacter vulcani]
MPKDTKKFINPLLRPSQSSEPRPAVLAPSEVEPARTEIQAQNVVSDKQANNIEPEVAPTVESIKSEEPAVAPQIQENTTKGSLSNSEVSNQQTSAFDEMNFADSGEKSRDSVKPQTSTKARTNTGSLTEGSAPRARQAATRRDANTLSASTRKLSGPLAGDIENDEYFNDLDASGEDNRAGVKRRRNIQPFESTHERITLWMDKQLKQRFEDLAYQRELPKTSLINEAVTALLQKYEDR